MTAAAMGEEGDCDGVAGGVALGQVVPTGTGSFNVALDIDMLKDVIGRHRGPPFAGSESPRRSNRRRYDPWTSCDDTLRQQLHNVT